MENTKDSKNYIFPHQGKKWHDIHFCLTSIENGLIDNEYELENTMNLIYDYSQIDEKSKKRKNFNVLKEHAKKNPKFYKELLPFIAKLAKIIEELFKDKSIPLLSMKKPGKILLSRIEVASLLANSFFSTLLFQPKTKKNDDNFLYILCHDEIKLPFILNYFERVKKSEPKGSIEITRNVISNKYNSVFWLKSKTTLKEIKMDITGSMYDYQNSEITDFANKYIGGGSLTGGCVQEEILFMIMPELIVSQIFCEKMCKLEAIIIKGAERFSNHSGYGHSFQYNGNFEDKTKFINEKIEILNRTIIAIDAKLFHSTNDKRQWCEKGFLREINKAFAGFSCEESQEIVTGNWGCGVFSGSPKLKLILQWIAAAEAKKKLIYCSFGDNRLKMVDKVIEKLIGKEIGAVLKMILEMCKKNETKDIFENILENKNI